MSADLAAIRRVLSQSFSEEALRNLALDLFPEVYRDFAAGMRKSAMIRDILEYAHEHGRLEELLAYARRENPYQFDRYLAGWPEEAEPGASSHVAFFANASYGLEEGFTGRQKELETLEAWLTGDPDHPLLAVIALGGTGKSALAWRWLDDLRQRLEPPLTTMIWWSFYELQAGPVEFLSEVLTFLGDDPAKVGGPRLQLNRLLNRFAGSNSLLVLDGAERLLRAYHNPSAPYQGDAVPIEPHASDCVDPLAAYLMTGLAQTPGAKTLLTSRLLPRELEGRGRELVQGVRRLDLTGLDLAEAQALFHELGIRATRAEVRTLCEPLDYHPLSLRLLAGYVADDPLAPGYLSAAADYDPTMDLLGQREHVLSRAYANLPPSAQSLLGRLAAFRSSVAGEVIQEIFGQEANWREDLALLVRRGLLQRSIQDGLTSYDLHPIVRRYAYDRLVDPAAVHEQLAGYFEAVPPVEKVNTLADLAPTIELYHHLVRSGRFNEALYLFRARLWAPLYYQLSVYRTVFELLDAFSPVTLEEQQKAVNESDLGWILAALAITCSRMGRPAAAVQYFERQISIRERQDDRKNMATALGNLAQDQMDLGNLVAAERNLTRSRDLSREIRDRFREAVARREIGRLLAYQGDYLGAAAELEAAMTLAKNLKHLQAQGLTWASRARAALLQGEGRAGLIAASEFMRLIEEQANADVPFERDYVRAHWLLGWANLLLGNSEAQRYLDVALQRCRMIDMVDLEPAILLAYARLAQARGRGEPARRLAEEARDLAARAEYRLDLADIYNFLAQLAIDRGDQTIALTLARQARGYAWCNGPPHAYQSALDEADRLLAILTS